MFDFTKDADSKNSAGKKSSLGFGHSAEKSNALSSGGKAMIKAMKTNQSQRQMDIKNTKNKII